MGYRVQMSGEVQHWLATVLAEDRQVGRVVGEAVAVLFVGGPGLGEPLVKPLRSLLRAEHPVIALDHAYQRQLELLQRVGRSGADRDQAASSSQRLRAGVDAFRARKEAVRAGCTAARARQEIDQEFAAFGAPQVPGPAADDVIQARAAVDELLQAAADLEERLGGDAAPETLSELRLDSADLRLLFAAESPDTAVLLVVGMGCDDWGEWYDEALPLARAELHNADDDFTTYDLAAFLSEYFPGEEAEVQVGATRLIGQRQY